MAEEVEDAALRIDVWLWRARFFKTRGAAARFVEAGGVRRNDQRLDKASRTVRIGDVLLFVVAGRVMEIRIETFGTRRGPAAEARSLYTEIGPSPLLTA